MSLFGLIVVICLLIVGFWAVNKYAPNDPPVRIIGNVVLLVVLILVILSVIGLIGPVGDVRIR